MPIYLHLSKALPKLISSIESDMLSGLIAEDLDAELTRQLSEASEKFANILKSPAFFSIRSGFALREYIKNSNDSGADRIDFYICIDAENNQINCAVIDSGTGFPESFLEKPSSQSKMINYHECKIQSVQDASGRLVTHINSNKRQLRKQFGHEKEKLKIQGGEGLALVSISRVLHTGNGTAEIGNVSDLSERMVTKLKIQKESHPQGAVLLFTSELFSPELFARYDTATYGVAGNNIHYVNYVRGIEFAACLSPQHAYNLIITSPTSLLGSPYSQYSQSSSSQSSSSSLSRFFTPRSIDCLNSPESQLPGCSKENYSPLSEGGLHTASSASLQLSGKNTFFSNLDNLKTDTALLEDSLQSIDLGTDESVSPTAVQAECSTPKNLMSWRPSQLNISGLMFAEMANRMDDDSSASPLASLRPKTP